MKHVNTSKSKRPYNTNSADYNQIARKVTKRIAIAQRLDESISQIKLLVNFGSYNDYSVKDDILYNEKEMLVVIEELQLKIIRKFMNEVTLLC